MPIFSAVHDVIINFFKLNSDLAKISEGAFQQHFNPDPTKPAQEEIFSRKLKKEIHP